MKPRWLHRALTGDLQLLMASNLVEAATRFAAFVLYSRTLGAEGLGVVASAVAMAHLSNHLLQLGVDTSVISLGSKAWGRQDRDELERICRTGFVLQLAIGLALAVAGVLVAPFLAERFHHDPTRTSILVAAFAGVPILRVSRFGLVVLRTHQRFRLYAAATATSTISLLVVVGLLYLRSALSVLNVVVLLLIVIPAIQLAVSLPGIPGRTFLPGVPRRDDVRRILDFGKWVWGTTLLSSGIRHLNVLLLVGLAGEAATGYYQTGRRYAEFLSLVFEPLRRYLVPRLTALQDTASVLAELRRTYAWLAWTLLALPVAWLGGGPVIRLVQGAEWQPAVLLFQILVLVRLFQFLAQPLGFALFSVQRPQVQTYVQLAAFLAWLAAASVLIPRWEALGSALAILLSSILALSALAWYVARMARDARS